MSNDEALAMAVQRYWGPGGSSSTLDGEGIPGCRRAQRDAFITGAKWALKNRAVSFRLEQQLSPLSGWVAVTDETQDLEVVRKVYREYREMLSPQSKLRIVAVVPLEED